MAVTVTFFVLVVCLAAVVAQAADDNSTATASPTTSTSPFTTELQSTSGISLCTESEHSKATMKSFACVNTQRMCAQAAGSDNARKCECFLDVIKCIDRIKICVVPTTPAPTSAERKQQEIQLCVMVSGCTVAQCDAVVDPPPKSFAVSMATNVLAVVGAIVATLLF